MSTADPAVLVEASRRIILAGQGDGGGYIASPRFAQYAYAWLRDGSFCALAMDAIGEHGSSWRFHEWVASTVLARRDRIHGLIESARAGRPDCVRALPARYRLDGTEEGTEGGWPNFQLDGYGTWLYALFAHGAAGRVAGGASAARLVADYLAAYWRHPCFDYWEEFGDRTHTATLAAIVAGLRAAARLLDEPDYEAEASQVRAELDERCVSGSAFVKGTEDDRVDASLFSLRLPFGLVDDDDPRWRSTRARILAELSSPTGGIRRYLGDTYYGGSPWQLLTAWSGWEARVSGDRERFRAARDWLASRAQNGELAEQDVSEPQHAESVPEWESRWGPVASPLLWSHAKFILLENGGEGTQW